MNEMEKRAEQEKGKREIAVKRTGKFLKVLRAKNENIISYPTYHTTQTYTHFCWHLVSAAFHLACHKHRSFKNKNE